MIGCRLHGPGSHDDGSDRVTHDDLMAYAEGRLPPGIARRARVENWLRTHPADAARVRAYMHQDQSIRSAWGDVANETIPDRLLPDRIRQQRRPMARTWLRPTAMAAAFALAMVTGFLAGRADLGGTTPQADSDPRTSSEVATDQQPITPAHGDITTGAAHGDITTGADAAPLADGVLHPTTGAAAPLIPTEATHAPELRIAPIPEMMPPPATAPGGV